MLRSPSILPGERVSSSVCNKRGMTLIEVMIALLLLSAGVFALMSIQASSWRLAGRSDYLGRAAGILQRQLHATEARLMNPAAGVIPGTENQEPVYASGQNAPQAGDAAFRVETTITDLGGGTSRVMVRVSWPGNPGGISESLIASRQEYFRQ